MAREKEVPSRPGGSSHDAAPDEKRRRQPEPRTGGSESDRGKQGDVEPKGEPASHQRGRTDRNDYEGE